MIISEKIFNILNEKGISQKAFSEKTGISQSTISDWKRKGTNPSADKIMTICDALDISLADLLGIDQIIVEGCTKDEALLIEACRAHPELQHAVRVLLGVNFK